MQDIIDNRRNWAARSGFFLALGAILCNLLPFAHVPARAIPWLSIVLAVVSLVPTAIALQRILLQPQRRSGRVQSILLSLFALLLTGMAILGFVHARALPRAAAAPRIGQKAPEFILADTAGRPVSLDQLFAPVDAQSAAPKSVLLIFYRGYW